MDKTARFLALSLGVDQNFNFPCTLRRVKLKVSVKSQVDGVSRLPYQYGRGIFCKES